MGFDESRGSILTPGQKCARPTPKRGVGMTDEARPIFRGDVDRAGVVSSSVCAVHCASTGAAPSAVAALGLSVPVGPVYEWGFTALAIVLAVSALLIGWRRHRTLSVALVLGAGVAGLALGRALEAMDFHGVGTALSIAAGLALVVGHIGGIRANRARGEAPR